MRCPGVLSARLQPTPSYAYASLGVEAPRRDGKGASHWTTVRLWKLHRSELIKTLSIRFF
jgi:hypothetical protein